MRTRPGAVEPEIYFRIVHLAQNDIQGAPLGSCREQTIEISLGPKGVFENGNIGALTRWVTTARIVSATPPLRAKLKPPKEPKMPRVVELLRKAIEWQILLKSGKIATQADIARREGISRARVTQIMVLLRLTQATREHILALPDNIRRPTMTERMLRSIAVLADRDGQVREFHGL
ncbi:MAG: hypothetical protein WC899_12445 [bacterium]|jgi:hypothetical protein